MDPEGRPARASGQQDRAVRQLRQRRPVHALYAIRGPLRAGLSHVGVGAADVVFEDRGVKVIVDAESLRFVDGTEIDFARHGLNEAFKFRNPNVRGECGCGESFNV